MLREKDPHYQLENAQNCMAGRMLSHDYFIKGGWLYHRTTKGHHSVVAVGSAKQFLNELHRRAVSEGTKLIWC